MRRQLVTALENPNEDDRELSSSKGDSTVIMATTDLGHQNGNMPTTNDLEIAINDALDGIKSRGVFSCFGRPHHLVDPYICIGSDVTPILLPLQADGAARIVRASHQGSLQCDKNVRHSWELRADQFTMLNERPFHEMLSGEVIPMVASGLGHEG